MALVHWDPTRELSLLQGDMNRLFERFMGDGSPATERPRRWIPAMDIIEAEDRFLLRADLPGLDQDDVTIEVLDDTLRITGQRRSEHRNEASGFVRLERSFGAFERTLSLPDGVDAEAIEASFDKGVLELAIPKPVATAPRRITIGTKANTEVEASTTDSADSPADPGRSGGDRSKSSRRLTDRVLAKA